MSNITMDEVSANLKQICSLFQLTMSAVEEDDYATDPRQQKSPAVCSPDTLNAMLVNRFRGVYIPALNAIYGSLYNLRAQVADTLEKSVEVSDAEFH